MRARLRYLGAFGAVALALGLLPATAGHAETPSYFPTGFTLDTTSYSLRMAGPTRFSTAGTLMEMFLPQQGDTETGSRPNYPFDESNPQDPAKGWGFDECTDGVGIATSDTPADSLSASSIFNSEPVNVPMSNSPGSGNPDLGAGAILLTSPNRDNSDPPLSSDTVKALQQIQNSTDHGSNGCHPNIVIFGQQKAVGPRASNDLTSLGQSVYRIGGTDRFDTARLMGLYAGGPKNIRLFSTSTSTGTVTPNTVFLAEGFTGADALGVGPYAARNHVPVLLTTTGALPAATQNALVGMSPTNIVVLGGEAAISASAASAAAAAAGGATVTRIAGATRYETSVKLAEMLDDLWPQNGIGASFSGQAFGFARSEGTGSGHVGWPDALAANWWLGHLSLGDDPMPVRLAPPVEHNVNGDVRIGGQNQEAIHDGNQGTGSGDPGECETDVDPGCIAVPLLLTPQSSLDTTVTSFLGGMYPNAGGTAMKTANNPTGVNDGGFGFVFGGTSAVSRAAELSAAQLLSGNTYVPASGTGTTAVASTQTDLAPTLAAGSVFYTAGDLSGYTSGASVGSNDGSGGVDDPNGSGMGAGGKICFNTNAATGSEWMTLFNAASVFNSQGQLLYQPPLTGYTPFQSRFTCVVPSAIPAAIKNKITALATSPTGHITASKALDWNANTVSGDGTGGGATTVTNTPSTSGDVYTEQAEAKTATASFTENGAMPNFTQNGTVVGTATYHLSLTVTRTDPTNGAAEPDSITVAGTLQVTQTSTTGSPVLFSANLSGIAVGISPTGEMGLVGEYTAGSGGSGAWHIFLTGPATGTTTSDLEVNGLF